MLVAIGSRNGAKAEAVREVFLGIWPEATFEQVEVLSGVAVQPLTDDETRQGAINRARAALAAVIGADFGVGLEGGVAVYGTGADSEMYLKGWVAVVDRYGRIGLGSSANTPIPHWIRQRLEVGEELGPIDAELTNDPTGANRHNGGTHGTLTAGGYTRTQSFHDGLVNALAPFIQPDLYEGPPKA